MCVCEREREEGEDEEWGNFNSTVWYNWSCTKLSTENSSFDVKIRECGERERVLGKGSIML